MDVFVAVAPFISQGRAGVAGGLLHSGRVPAELPCLACLPVPVTCDLDTYQAYQTYGIPVHGQWEWEKR